MTNLSTKAAEPGSVRAGSALDTAIKVMSAHRGRWKRAVGDYIADNDSDLEFIDLVDDVRRYAELIEIGIIHDAAESDVVADVGLHFWQGRPELRKKLIDNLRSIADAVERAA